MSVKRIVPLPAFSGVTPGVTATVDIPVGPRYHVIWLEVSSQDRKAAKDILDVCRLKVNGKVQRSFTADELNQLNALMGEEYKAYEIPGDPDGVAKTFLPIFLAEPWRKQVAAQDGLAWATGNVATFQLECDIKSGVSSPALSGFVEVDNSVVVDKDGKERQAPLGIICKWYRLQIPVNGTKQDITTFPRRDYYQQISFFDESIEKVEIKIEGFTVRELTKEENDAVLISREMVPSKNRFDVVFDHDDILNSALPMKVGDRPVSDFQVKLYLSDGTPRNIPCIYQTLGPAD